MFNSVFSFCLSTFSFGKCDIKHLRAFIRVLAQIYKSPTNSVKIAPHVVSLYFIILHLIININTRPKKT